MASHDSPLSGGFVRLEANDGGPTAPAHLPQIDPDNHVVMIDNCKHSHTLYLLLCSPLTTPLPPTDDS